MKVFSNIKIYDYNKYFLTIVTVCLLFQFTQLKYIWNLSQFSQPINIFIIITSFLNLSFWLFNYKLDRKIWIKYILPLFLIFLGYSINILYSVYLDFNNVSVVGLIIPSLLSLSIPYFYKKGKIDIDSTWKFLYTFIKVVVFLGLIDYVLIFFTGFSGTQIETPYGYFIKGYFSIYHDLGGGIPYFRFYSCFGEPGDLGMWLIPLILYSFYYKKYLDLIIFSIAFILAFSLGSIISLLLAILITQISKKRFLNVVVGLTFVIGIFFYSGIDNFLNQFYEDKGLSADVREDNLINGIKSIPTLIIKNPFGLTLNSKTSDNEKNVFYVGTNFLPITYLQQGGVFSFIGIILLLYFSIYDSYRMLFNDKLSKLYRVLSITLICYFPFIFQRMTVWDSVIFAFLFLPILFKLNEKSFK